MKTIISVAEALDRTTDMPDIQAVLQDLVLDGVDSVEFTIDDNGIKVIPVEKDSTGPTSDSVHVPSIAGNKPKMNLFELNKALGNEEERYTFSPWYVPDSLDAHNEWTDKAEVQKAFWKYLAQDDRDIRLQHNTDIVAGQWVEGATWPFEVTVPVKHPEGDIEHTFPAGTPFLGIVWEPWAWQLIKSGDIRGLSIGGTAQRMAGDIEIDKEYNPTGRVQFEKMIREENGKFHLFSHDGSRHLGEFSTREAAEARDAEIKRISHAVEKALDDAGIPMFELPDYFTPTFDEEVKSDVGFYVMEPNELADELSGLLEDYVNLKFLAQGYHWNVRGQHFHEFHEVFGEFSQDMDAAIDPVAENIRKLNVDAPFRISDFQNDYFQSIAIDSYDPLMLLKSLYMANEYVKDCVVETMECAIKYNEQGIANFLAERQDLHSKWQWQLRSMVGNDYANEFFTDVTKHMEGKHDQSSHGKGGTSKLVATVPNKAADPQKWSAEAISLAQGLRAKAEQLEPALTQEIFGVVTKHGGSFEFLEQRIKSDNSLARKIDLDAEEKFGGDRVAAAENVKDSVRYTMLVGESRYTDAVAAVEADFKAQGYEVKTKNYWLEGDPYQGVNMALKKNGIAMEFQIHTKKSASVKNAEHKLYDQYKEAPNNKVRWKAYDAMVKMAATVPRPVGYATLMTLGTIATQPFEPLPVLGG